MIRLAMASPAATAIVPVQDLLSLGTEARMNVPGKTDGNWAFRYVASALDEPLATRLRAITETFARL
jgi:4-alpha-glucanotransferase